MLHKKDYQNIAKSLAVRMAHKRKTFGQAIEVISDVARCLEGTNPNYKEEVFTEFARQSFLAARKEVRFKNIVAEDLMRR